MPAVLKLPKVQVALFLTLLFAASYTHLPTNTALSLLTISVGSSVLFDIVLAYIRRRRFFIPYSGIVTGLIITLVIDPSASWYQILAVAGVAISLKNFLRFFGRHVFNPAASGLLAGWALFGLNPSWWAPTLFGSNIFTVPNMLIILSILAVAHVAGFRMKKLAAIVTFLFVYTVTFAFITGNFSPQSLLLTVTSVGTLFYAGVMLPEPMTSPIRRERQIMYGALVAILNGGFVFLLANNSLTFLSNPPDPSLAALFLGNLVFFKLR